MSEHVFHSSSSYMFPELDRGLSRVEGKLLRVDTKILKIDMHQHRLECKVDLLLEELKGLKQQLLESQK